MHACFRFHSKGETQWSSNAEKNFGGFCPLNLNLFLEQSELEMEQSKQFFAKSKNVLFLFVENFYHDQKSYFALLVCQSSLHTVQHFDMFRSPKKTSFETLNSIGRRFSDKL